MITILIIIMLLSGVLGALIATGLSEGAKTPAAFGWNLATGVGASFLVPLFLNTVSSKLITNIVAELKPADSKPGESSPADSPINDLLVLGGFCTLASASSRKFISSLAQNVLSQIEATKEIAVGAAKKAEATAEKTEQAHTAAVAAADAVRYGIRETVGPENLSLIKLPEVAPGTAPDDPWAGQFGGAPTASSRVLSAAIGPIDGSPGFATVRLSVRSSDPAKPLQGTVQFYLHPTFGPNHKPIVPVTDGEAVLTLTCWGAFTVGALCDNGAVKLELDLSKQSDAFEPWRSR